MVKKIISGGQTGVDTAALDAAIAQGLDYGGWCPQGRINEQGKIDDKYSRLVEITGIFANEQANYDQRTRWNIRDSDATLILAPQLPLPPQIKDGTVLTINEVEKRDKPFLVIDLSKSKSENENIILHWLNAHSPQILNVGGPRESIWPGIYRSSFALMTMVFSHF